MSTEVQACSLTPQPAEAPQALPAPVDASQVSVVIPAYNEAAGIAATLLELREAAPQLDVVVVDDGSTDGTAAAARGVPGVRVVSHTRNRGYGAAIKTGVRHCTGRCVAWYDADGQHRPRDLLAVVRPVVAGERDVVIGVRGRDSAVQRDRAAGKWLLGKLARLISGEDVPDLNSGLRCFRRDVIARYLHLLPDTFSASSTSTLLAIKRGYRVGYVPIVAQERIGASTVRIVADGLRTLQLIVRIVVLFEAFRVFTALGAALFVPGLLYGVLWALIFGRGFPTLAAMMVITGVFTFFMGILADQVVELRKERFEDSADGR